MFLSISGSRRLLVEDDVCGLDLAVHDGRGSFEVHGSARQDAGASEPLHHPPLRRDVLAGVIDGQPVPEVEAAGFSERRPIEEHAPADPRDAVGNAILGVEIEFGCDVREIRRIVEGPAREAGRMPPHPLGRTPAPPELEHPRLLRADVIEVREALHRVPDKSAVQLVERRVQPVERVGFEPYIVVEVEDPRGPGELEQELPLFGEASTGKMSVHVHLATLRAEHSDHLEDRGIAPGDAPFGLVADDDSEVQCVLGGQSRERHGERRRAPGRRDEHVDPRLDGGRRAGLVIYERSPWERKRIGRCHGGEEAVPSRRLDIGRPALLPVAAQ